MEGQSVCGMIKLNPSNYEIWKRKMQDLLIVKDLFLPIMGKQKLEKMSDDN